MEIKNEEHAREMIGRWRGLPLPAQKRELNLAIQKLELGCMYFEQKGNDQGACRCMKCITLLRQRLEKLQD
jgi:hypothetical protein